MDIVREILVEGDEKRLTELVNDPRTDQNQLYHRFCEFYDECETRGYFDNKIINHLTGFIVKYRMNYKSENNPPKSSNSFERIQLLKSVLTEYSAKDFTFASKDEMVLFLRFVVRLINVFKLKDQKQLEEQGIETIPWKELHFLMSVEIAKKSQRAHHASRVLEGHFQLIFDEEFIWDQLRSLLASLKNYETTRKSAPISWEQLEFLYRRTFNYYLLHKIWDKLLLLCQMNMKKLQSQPKVSNLIYE